MFQRSVAFFSVLTLVAAATAQPPAPAPTKTAEPPKPAQPTAPAPTKPDAPKPAAPAETPKPPAAEAKVVFVKMTTTEGDIIIELNNEKAPISTANFLSYVDKKFYEGVIFHRVMPDFMIQGGGLDRDMKPKATDKPIKNEWQNGLKNLRGTLSMARTAAPDSATSQFFINVADNDGTKKYNLDQPNGGAAYAVFGRVTHGMDVVDKIKNAPTVPDGRENSRPVNPVVITSVVRITPEQAAAAGKPAAAPSPTAPAPKPTDAAKPAEAPKK